MQCVVLTAVLLLPLLSCVRPLRFVAIGDWGDDDGIQYQVAATMADWAEEREPEFVMSLGDNFYPEGVESVDDQKWWTRWQFPYMQYPSLQVPWMISLGNHDWYGGSVQPQVDYTNLDPYWTLPTNYFTFRKMAGNATVEFVAIDSHVIDEQPWQVDWLNATLRESDADWLIVYGHHPVYSSGFHGEWDDVGWLDRNVKPLLQENDVAFLLCGHDHDQQHITDGSVVDYVVSGGGHDIRSVNPWAWVQTWLRGARVEWRSSSKGFIDVEIVDNEATVQFVNELGEVIHSLTKTNPRTTV